MLLFHICKKSKCDVTAFFNPRSVLSSRFEPGNSSYLVKANLFFTILFLPVLSYGQSEGEFAILSSTEVCGTNLGSIDVTIVGDPDSYTWYWVHGATDLDLTNLAAGTYTFVITNMYGCTKTYNKVISELTSCSFSYSIIDDPVRKCVATIQMIVTSNGIPLDESALSIVWADGNTSGLIREVTRFEEATYEVTITLINDEGSCCYIHEFINVTQEVGCDNDFKKKEVIVNEFYRDISGQGQFLELLVIGNGVCGDTFDLRGFHVDDNNGYLAPANEFVNSYNINSIGINSGYLTFSYADSWASIPVGSLIVLHSEIRDDGYDENFPEEDPTDSNGDGVFVVAADNTSYLTSRSGVWDPTNKMMQYGGYIIPPLWQSIALSEGADGIQVRYPDFSFSHGISLGQTVYTSVNEFPLWITDNTSTSCNCRFMETDYLSKTHFECSTAESNLQSPGSPNSINNAALIDTLTNCLGNRSIGENLVSPSDSPAKQSLNVFPNPFSYEIYLEFESNNAGESKASIYAVTGQLIQETTYLALAGEHVWKLPFINSLYSGIYILVFEFPDGESIKKRVMHFR